MIPKDAVLVAESVTYFQGDSEPAREPRAACDACGERGTVARVTRHTHPPTVRRYCRRCWPRAHSLAIEALCVAIARIRRAALDPTGRGPLPPPPPAESRRWHWSVALGSAWREIMYDDGGSR